MADIIKMRRMSDTMEEGVIVDWLVKVGDKVKIGDPIAEVETDKATMDFDVPVEGTILHLEAKVGSTIPIDGVMAVIGAEGEDFKDELKKALSSSNGQEKEEQNEQEDKKVVAEESKSEEKTPEKAQPTKEAAPSPRVETSNDGRIKASPLAKKLAEKEGIDLNTVKGSGDSGRIVKRDIENYDAASAQKSSKSAASPFVGESHEDLPISQMRKAIARRLSESKFTAPHFYLTREISMDRVMEARKSINEYIDTKVSFNDIIVKSVAHALKANPQVNSSWLGDKIRLNHHVNIGVATAIEDGLIVPVVKNADTKSISQISTEIKELAQKARDKKLQPEEFTGNTFTISNLGMFGIDEFTAIINSPDACILAVGAIKQQPIVKNGQLAVGHVMKVTLSCDHRVVDGAKGSQFLQTLASFLEEPIRILA